MMNCPNWMIPAMQRRFDDIDQAAEQDPKIQRMKREAQKLFDALKGGMGAEQQDLFKHWDEQLNYCIALEKEALYRRGFIDGIHLSAAIFDSKLQDQITGFPEK
ncbi:MAG TPA: hypothetical protein VGE40_05735 [Bacilli bacterium]